jgi:putative protein-disulfide isomerase
MSTTTLHYVFDPLCGWCYAASPLVVVARERLPVHLHAGGMMTGAQRQPVTPQLRQYVLAHDERIAQLSGQPFGDGYRDGLLRDAGAVFDSEPPITAILAADAVAGRGLDLLQRMQRAHYVQGRRIADAAVLAELAADIGLEPATFAANFDSLRGAATAEHIARSRTLLVQAGGQGFPTFVLEEGAALRRIDISPFIGQVERWRDWLDRNVEAAPPPLESMLCTPEACALPDRKQTP